MAARKHIFLIIGIAAAYYVMAWIGMLAEFRVPLHRHYGRLKELPWLL